MDCSAYHVQARVVRGNGALSARYQLSQDSPRGSRCHPWRGKSMNFSLGEARSSVSGSNNHVALERGLRSIIPKGRERSSPRSVDSGAPPAAHMPSSRGEGERRTKTNDERTHQSAGKHMSSRYYTGVISAPQSGISSITSCPRYEWEWNVMDDQDSFDGGGHMSTYRT